MMEHSILPVHRILRLCSIEKFRAFSFCSDGACSDTLQLYVARLICSKTTYLYAINLLIGCQFTTASANEQHPATLL